MTDELLAVADRVVAMAAPGEQVEAVVVRGTDTEIQVYGGEVESLSSAQSQGVGIRVIVDGRQGFAYAGTLDDDVIAETLAEARDNAGFATPDEFVGLAEPDGVAVHELDLFREALRRLPAPTTRSRWPSSSSGPCSAADPRISGIESAEYVDGVSEAAVATTTGIRSSAARPAATSPPTPWPTRATTPRPASASRSGASPPTSTRPPPRPRPAERATRLLGAIKPPTGRLTVVLDPCVTAQFLGILGYTLNGEAVLKGRSLFADRLGEEVASPLVTLVDDPTDLRAFTATDTDGEGLATRRNVLIARRRARRCSCTTPTPPGGPARSAPATRCGASSARPSVGCLVLSLAARHHRPGRADRRHRRRRAHRRRSPACTRA